MFGGGRVVGVVKKIESIFFKSIIIMELADGLVMARELVLEIISGVLRGDTTRHALTFDRVHLAALLMQLSVSSKPLTHHLIAPIPVLMFMLMSAAEVLVMVEDGGTYGLLGPVLANDVVVHPFLQVARVEMRDAEGGLVEHGPPPGID